MSGPGHQDGAPTGLVGIFTNFRLALLLLIAIVGWGLVSLRDLPKERWPEVDVPMGFVTAVYPGAPADLVEAEVVQVLERELGGIPDTTSLRSTSMESVAIVLVEFDVSADADARLDDVAERLESARGDLPDSVEEIGGTLDDVSKAIENAQTTVPLGRFQSDSRNFPLDVGRVGLDLDALGALSVRSSSTGSTVALHSVATQVRTTAEPTESARFVRNLDDGSVFAGDSLSFDVKRQPGANVPVVVKALEAELDELRASLPPGTDLVLTTDRGAEIIGGILMLLENGAQAVLLVFVLLFLFIGTRESIVAGLSIPITFLATFGVLLATGQSLNNLSLMALVIALGLLVDDFILVVEGMHEYLHEGHSPVAAAVATVKTFAAPSLSGSLTTICAFLPLAMLGGLQGRFIQVIPLTICICLVVSYTVSVTLDTSLGSAFLRKAKTNPVTAFVQAHLDRLAHWYEHSVVPRTLGSRRQRLAVLGSAAVAMGCSFGLAGAQRLARRVEEQLSGDPDLDVVTISAGRRSTLAQSTPVSITHQAAQPNVIIMAEAAPGYSPVEVAAEVERRLGQVELGQGDHLEVAGDLATSQQTNAELVRALGIAGCLIFSIAVRAASVARLRPILLTSLTTVIGLLPLAMTDRVWQGLCMAIVYGISLATVLTLVVIPALYLVLEGAGDLEPAGLPSPAPASTRAS